MGQIFSSIIGTCNCSSENDEEHINTNEIVNIKSECVTMKERLNRLETMTHEKHNITNQKIENLELRIA